MSEKEFIEKMADILDNDDINMETELDELDEWDSISFVAFISFCAGKGKKISPKELREAEIIADLYNLYQR